MVWDRHDMENCPLEIQANKDLRLEMPLDDEGLPIKDRAHVYGIVAVYKSTCGHIEIRRESR